MAQLDDSRDSGDGAGACCADTRRTPPPLLWQGRAGAGGPDGAVPPRPGRSGAAAGAVPAPTSVCAGHQRLRCRLPRLPAALPSTACVWVAVLLHGSMRAGGGGVQALTVRPPGWWGRGAGLRSAQRAGLRGPGAGSRTPGMSRLCMSGREAADGDAESPAKADDDESEPILANRASRGARKRERVQAAARTVWAGAKAGWWTRAVTSISNRALRIEEVITTWQQGGLRRSMRSARGADSQAVRQKLGLDFSPEKGDVADLAWSGDSRDAVNAVGTVTLARDAAPATAPRAASTSSQPTNSNGPAAASPTSAAMSLATSAYLTSLYDFTDDGRKLSAISRYADDYWISNLLTMYRSRVFQRIFSR